MKTLADEVLDVLPALAPPRSKGATVPALSKRLDCPAANIRDAMRALHDCDRAMIVRHGERGDAQRLVPMDHDFGLGYPARPCRTCEKVFTQLTDGARFCSRSCRVKWSWRDPDVRARRIASIKVERQTPEAKERLRQHNIRRWSKPEEHAKLSEQNRREWADPAKRAKRSAGIQAANGSPEMRKKYSDRKKEQWKDADYREHTIAAATAGHRTSYSREKASRLLKERWQNPQTRPRYMAGAKKGAAKRAAAMKGKPLPPKHKEKAAEGRKRAKAKRTTL